MALALGAQTPRLVQPPEPVTTATPAALTAQGLDHFYNLEYNRAVASFQQLTRLTPASPAAWNHLAQAELYREMYRIGALESELYGHGDPFLQTRLLPPDPAAINAITAADDQARALATAAVAAHPGDAQAHYALAAAWALRGNLDFSLKKSYWGALGDAKAARREAERAVALAPDFVDPKLIIGVQNYVAGSLPWGVRLMSALVGYRGNKELGRQQVADVAAHGEHARTDAAVLLGVMDRRDGLNRQAAPLWAGLARQYPRNPLFAVEAAEALEAAGEHDAARAAYERILARADSGAAGYQHAPLDKVWYDLGNIERVYSRWSAAAADFEKVWNLHGARTLDRQAAALAAGEAYRRAGDPAAARNAYLRCAGLDPASPAGRAARRALNP